MVNKKFNNWLVIEEVKVPNQNSRHYRCKCKCGSINIVNGYSLRTSKSKQCRKCSFHKHDMSETVTYRIWVGMRTRCYNPNVRIYKYYGGRGIKVCDRWKSFVNFYSDMGERPKGLQLDRTNNDRDYSPDNCRWVTPSENNAYNKGTVKDDMPGKRFGKWYVENRVEHKKDHWYYMCLCDCGTKKITSGGELRRGHTTQCKKCKDISHRGWGERRKSKTNAA